MLEHSYDFEALGTTWKIESDTKLSAALIKLIEDRIEAFDVTYSRFREDSLVTQIANKEGAYTFPQDANALFSTYRILYDQTEGKVTPLVGDMISRAGYDAIYSFISSPQKSAFYWDEVMKWESPVLTTHQPLTLDFGAAGKGYLVDILAKLLDTYHIHQYVIDASGDMKHKGNSENRVGLEHPLDPTKVIGVISVKNSSLCASATNRRTWGENMHHIFDPLKVEPVRDVIATWVVARDAMVADGVATALFFPEVKTMHNVFEYEYVRMYSNGSIDYSASFEGQLF